MKNNLSRLEKALMLPKVSARRLAVRGKDRQKMLAMLAPSFVVDFKPDEIISQLKQLGIDKVVELTFGAKMVNREYHRLLENSDKLVISSTCAGIQQILPKKFPKYKKNLAKINSPMIATAKISKKYFPNHKVLFISPCQFKKIEAQKSKFIDYVLDYHQLHQLFEKYNIKAKEKTIEFEKFYNDYTKVFPLSGGLSKTAHIKGILKKGHEKIIDGWQEIEEFLKSGQADKIKFLDITFCKGGCIGGPCTNQSLSLEKKKELVLQYLKESEEKKIPENRKGLIKKAVNINFKN